MKAPVHTPTLFLDFDGVLNHHAWLLANGSGADERQLDPACVARLSTIVTLTGCDVVVSSCWRILHPTGELQQILRNASYTGRLHGRTPSSASGVRGEEIQAWLDARGNRRPICILDDSADMAHLMPFLVRTSSERGLLDEHVDRAVKMLGGSR